MRIQSAIQAALEASRISDPIDVQKIQAPLRALRENSPYIEFLDELANPVGFQSDIAHVVTKVDGKAANHVRNIKRADGRPDFTVPSLRFEAPAEIQIYKGTYREESEIESLSHRMPAALAEGYASLVHLHVLSALLASAENQGNVIYATKESLKDTVRETVNNIDGPSSVISNAKYSSRVMEQPWGEKVIGEEGHICQSWQLDEDIILIVEDNPNKVGFVWIESPPEMFVSVSSPGILRSAVIGECRICVWGDAKITKVDLRPKS